MSNTFHISPLVLLLTSFYVTIAASTEREAVSKSKTTDPSYTNKLAPSDSYTMFKHLMEVKEDIAGEKAEKEPKVEKTVKQALQSLFEAALKGFVDGFLPDVDRQRREATDDRRSYLDIAIGAIGGLAGEAGVRRDHRVQVEAMVLTLWRLYVTRFRTSKLVGQKVPGASLAVMMIEGIVPKSFMNWFRVVKTAVIDRSDNCDENFACSMVDEKDEDT